MIINIKYLELNSFVDHIEIQTSAIIHSNTQEKYNKFLTTLKKRLK